jgi:hypothetical protein
MIDTNNQKFNYSPRCHPHGALGLDRDMNGELTPPENSETDFPSPTPADPLTTSDIMSAVQCPTEIPTHPVAEEWHIPPKTRPRMIPQPETSQIVPQRRQNHHQPGFHIICWI